MNNLNGRIRKLEETIVIPHKPVAPSEALKRIEAIISRVFNDLPPRLKDHARRTFKLGEEKTDAEARIMLGNITLARKLKGGNL